MGRSSYRKFMKQERAKVKLKNKEKKLLPKGQNVTDLNFKVKKIVIKTQLKEHDEDEVLSTRKLNIQEVLSRLNHYSGSVSTEAVSQLESLLKCGGRAFLSTHLSTVVSNLAKLLTSPHSHLRKAAIKLLTNLLSQVEESEWLVLRGKVICYVVCGLSHVEPGVRSDSLLALETLPPSLNLPAESLLPPLLDLVSTSKTAGPRALSTTLSSSPTALRTTVLRRIAAVLSSLRPSSPVKLEGGVVRNEDDVRFVREDVVRVPLVPCYHPLLQHQSLSISEFSTSTQLSSSHGLDLKEFTLSLVPLMLDSFAEIAPEPDGDPVCRLIEEGLRLLGIVADILLLLSDLLSSKDNSQSCWMKDKLGSEIYKRLIEKRFPYGEELSSGRKQQRITKPSILRVNLTLALLAQTLAPHHPDSSRLASHFLSEVLRSNQSLGVEETALFERCLSVCLSRPSSKYTSHLLTSLTRLNRKTSGLYSEVFSVLRKVVSSGSRRKEMSEWLESLLTELAAPDSDLPQNFLDLFTEVAPLVDLPMSFHTHFPAIIRKAIDRNKEEELWSVSNLLYWVTTCDSTLLDTLQHLTENQHHLSTHITNLLIHKCERYPEGELSKQLVCHSYWKQMMTAMISV